jgi:hypothetical protein
MDLYHPSDKPCETEHCLPIKVHQEVSRVCVMRFEVRECNEPVEVVTISQKRFIQSQELLKAWRHFWPTNRLSNAGDCTTHAGDTEVMDAAAQSYGVVVRT